jgi:hypothetical protein
MDESFFSGIWSHHSVSHSFIAGLAGDHDIAPVHPHPHIPARDKERTAVVAEPAPEYPVDPYPLAHCNLPGKLHVPVTPFRVVGECLLCLPEQNFNAFPCDYTRRRVSGLLFHASEPVPGCAVY